MPLFPRPGITALLLAGALAPLGAQELQDAFRLLPPTTESLEIYRDPARMNRGALRVRARFEPQPKDDSLKLLPGLNLDLGLVGQGFALMAEFPTPQGSAKRQALLVPARNFAALAKALKAVKGKGGYTVTRGKAKFTLASRGTYAVISADPKLVEELKGAGANLAGELTPLAPWIATHDTVFLFPSASLKQGFQALRAAMVPKPGAPANAQVAAKLLAPVIGTLEASGTQFAAGVDFPEDGSIRAHARLFLKAGSPLSLECAQAPAPPSMGGLPSQGFVLGGGWTFPPSLQTWFGQLTDLGASMAPAGTDPALLERFRAQSKALNGQVKAQAMSLGVPARTGDPILSQFRTVVQVVDAPAYLKAWGDLVETQIQAKMTPPGVAVALKRDVLEGVPSASQTFTFERLEGLPVPPGQLKMLFSALFGTPDGVTVTLGQRDSGSLVAVLGGPEALRAALAPVAPTLDQDPALAAGIALVPGPAYLRFHVALDGVRALAQQVMDTFLPANPAHKLATLPATPALTLALQGDAGGLELSGAAAADSLDALAMLVHTVKDALPKQK